MSTVLAQTSARTMRVDTLGRRVRGIRQPVGEKLRLTDRDLLWLQKMHEHGPLPTSYLTAFSTLKSDKRAIERLGHLFHETPYLARPHQQFDTRDARYNQLIYDITPDAERLLKQERLFSQFAPQPFGHWKHKCMVSCITASVEIAALQNPNVEYIPQHSILERANDQAGDPVSLRFSVEFKKLHTGEIESAVVVPDAVFGLRYLHGTEPLYRFFFLEADRATEPNRSYRFNRKSWQRNVAQYRELVGRGSYKRQLHMQSSAFVLCVTTNTAHMHNIVDVVREQSGTGRNSFMLFQAHPEFGSYFRPPRPIERLLVEKYYRAGHSPKYIDRI